jgi:hypothetical protein
LGSAQPGEAPPPVPPPEAACAAVIQASSFDAWSAENRAEAPPP